MLLQTDKNCQYENHLSGRKENESMKGHIVRKGNSSHYHLPTCVKMYTEKQVYNKNKGRKRYDMGNGSEYSFCYL